MSILIEGLCRLSNKYFILIIRVFILSIILYQSLLLKSLGLDSSCEAVVKADNEAFSSLVTTQMAPAEVRYIS